MDVVDDRTDEITGHPFKYFPKQKRLSHCPPDDNLQESTAAPIPLCGDTEMPSSPQDMRDPVLVDTEPGTTDHPIPPGMRLDSKELYRGDKRDAWDDWTPDNLDMDPEDTQGVKRYALVVRREKSVGQSRVLLYTQLLFKAH